MYRQYEDPSAIQSMLDEAITRHMLNPDDVDSAIEVAELKERLNFAWQDDEYDDYDY